MPKKSHFFSVFFSIFLLVVLVALYFNRIPLLDFVKASSYSPSADMQEIRDSLGLTPRALRIFNATHPRLDSRDEFNSDCSSSDPDIAVYGCYTSDKIFVYNISDPELAGFREATTAHELLHAVWYRLSDAEQSRLIPLLEETYSLNESALKDSLATYDESERIDELYVRSATQIKTLPAELESHYSEIFTDQDSIVDFYNSYIAPFEELNEKIESLGSALESEKLEIDQKSAEYESRSYAFNSEVDSFNACANIPGCFSSDYEFNTRRNELLATASELDALYSELGRLIEAYNAKVDEYNSNILRSNNLQNLVNSNSKPESLN